jgi:uncharacterized protein YggE
MALCIRALPLLALLNAGVTDGRERGPSSTPDASPSPPRTIRVSGEGRASAPPDLATITLGAEAIGASLARARSEADAAMRRILAVVKDTGVDSKDVQTVRFDVQLERQWKGGQPGPITGYRVSSLARVKVRDLARIGELLDKVGAAGSNAIQGLTFHKEQTSSEEARALQEAVKRARAKAEALAKAAGVVLGDVRSITETVQAPQPISMRMEAALAQSSGTPVEPGEIDVRAVVEIVFSIE